MNAPAKITHRCKSGVQHCGECEGRGDVSNGRGLGGNDPASWMVDCPECHGEPIIACEVCGFDLEVPGYDCLACFVAGELPDELVTAEVGGGLAMAIAMAMVARNPAISIHERKGVA